MTQAFVFSECSLWRNENETILGIQQSAVCKYISDVDGILYNLRRNGQDNACKWIKKYIVTYPLLIFIHNRIVCHTIFNDKREKIAKRVARNLYAMTNFSQLTWSEINVDLEMIYDVASLFAKNTLAFTRYVASEGGSGTLST